MFLSRAGRQRQRSQRAARLASAALLARSGEDGAFAEDVAECQRLSPFVRKAWEVIEPGTEYRHNYHIDAMSEYLEAVDAGQILRLLINIPPRYMKSIECSVCFPVWSWTRKPFKRFMFTTY